jgi:hypothetical protein
VKSFRVFDFRAALWHVAYFRFVLAESFESPKRVSRRITRRFDGDMVADDIVLSFDAQTKRFRALFRPHPLALSDAIATEPVFDSATRPAVSSEAAAHSSGSTQTSSTFTTASSLVLDTPIWQKYLNYHTPVTFGIQNPAMVNVPRVQQNCGRFFPPRPKQPQSNQSSTWNSPKRAASSSIDTESEIPEGGQNGAITLFQSIPLSSNSLANATLVI